MNATAEAIKQRVTIPMVLELYGIPQNRHRRIPCPIHGGKNNNFGYTDTLYNCFVCHSKGDVIALVMALDGISFAAAMDKLNTAFAIGVGKQMTRHEQALAMAAFKERRKAETVRKQEEAKAQADYWRVFDEWKRLSDNKCIYAPKSPEDAIEPFFVEALIKLAYQEYLLDMAEIERRERVG